MCRFPGLLWARRGLSHSHSASLPPTFPPCLFLGTKRASARWETLAAATASTFAKVVPCCSASALCAVTCRVLSSSSCSSPCSSTAHPSELFLPHPSVAGLSALTMLYKGFIVPGLANTVAWYSLLPKHYSLASGTADLLWNITALYVHKVLPVKEEYSVEFRNKFRIQG